MTELAVIDSRRDGQPDDSTAAAIISAIREHGGSPEKVRIVNASSCAEISGRPDILVLTGDAAGTCLMTSERIQCEILLLPGDFVACENDAHGFDARCIVTYGMSPKNTITFSSISETTCVLAIQREFLTVNGDMLERQEIKIAGGMRPDRLLAVAGALLILGLRMTDRNP
jgi:hypothetical protein